MKRILGISAVSILFLLPFMIWDKGNLSVFSLTFVSIVLEAFPFMLAGALLSGAIEAFVPQSFLIKLLNGKKVWALIPFAGLLGLILPSCECAIIPLVRRLMKKGLPFSVALAYLLAGPIVNPLVILSTYYAYSFSLKITLIRVVVGYGIAVSIAFIMHKIFPSKTALIDELQKEGQFEMIEPASRSLVRHPFRHKRQVKDRILSFLKHSREEFFEVSLYLIIGAFIASFIQHFIGRQALSEFGSNSAFSIVMMMAFAIVSNLCSETDAFVAATFQGTGISLAAQMAFLLLGPMLDVKLFFMYFKILKKKPMFILFGFILLLVFALTFFAEGRLL